MATKTLKARVEIDGAREYKKQLEELSSGHRVLSSEMKLLQEQYRGSEQSMEAMTAKSELLERQLLQQRDKVKTLQAALQDSAERYGEADKRTQSWQIQLNNAQREELKLERALQDTNKALSEQGEASEDAGKKMTGLGDTIDGVAQKFGISIPDGAKEALNGVEGFSAGTVAKMAGAAAAVAAVVKVTKELGEMTLEAAERADALLTRSAQTGLDTSLLQGLDYAQRFLDFEGIDRTLVKLTSSMDAARDGAEKQAEAFDALGVSVTNEDGSLRDNYDTFRDVIDRLGDVQNATERDTIANALFGRSYSEMKPLIDAGTKSLDEYMKAAEENGIVLTESQVKKLGEVDDAHQKLQAQIEATKNQLAVSFAPAAIAAMEAFTKVVEVAGNAITWFNEKIANLLDLMGLSKNEMVGYDTIGSDVYGATWQSDVQAWVTAGGTIITPDIIDQIDKKTGKPKNTFTIGYNATGTDSWRGGLTWIGDAGPELVDLPPRSRIYSHHESRQIAASAGTDTRRIEGLLVETVGMLRELRGEVSGIEVRRRMA